jgi:hypothetical protein
MIALVFIFFYAFYNLDHLNIVYAIVPWNSDVPRSTLPGHVIYSAAVLLGGIGAIILTWATPRTLCSDRGYWPLYHDAEFTRFPQPIPQT